MNQFLVNDQPLVECSLMMPKIGAWVANDVTIDSDVHFNIGDSVTLQFMNQTFKGTILDAGVYEGFQRCTIIGGSGKLPQYLESAPYNSTTVGQVLRDIARKTDHTLSSSIDQSLLNTNLSSWNILKMKASLAIAKLVEEINCIWRILPDGTLWIGVENYTALNEQDFIILDKYPEQAKWEIYNESYLIQPLTSLSGNNIQQVEYYIKDNDLSMEVFFTLNFADSIDALTDQDDNILYNSIYRCQVVTQHSDGSLDLIPNPSLDLIKNGFVNVPIIYPFPGMKITVPNGTFCYVMFANGDPQFPRVNGWDDSGAATKVEMIHSNANPAARKGDACGYLNFQPGMSGATLTWTDVPAPGLISLKITDGSNTVSIGS